MLITAIRRHFLYLSLRPSNAWIILQLSWFFLIQVKQIWKPQWNIHVPQFSIHARIGLAQLLAMKCVPVTAPVCPQSYVIVQPVAVQRVTRIIHAISILIHVMTQIHVSMEAHAADRVPAMEILHVMVQIPVKRVTRIVHPE